MDVNEVKQRLMERLDKDLPLKVLRLLDYISKKIEKAVRKGKDRIEIQCPCKGDFILWGPKKILNNSSIVKLVVQYYRNLGFEVDDHLCISPTTIEIAWPINMQRYEICKEDEKLRHIVQTGMIPKVIKE